MLGHQHMPCERHRRFFMIILFGALVGSLFAPLPAAATEAAIVDRIVAVVNDDIITQHDLETTIRPYLENTKEQGFLISIMA